MPNFSFLACLEAAEKFVVGSVGWGGLQVTTMSNPNPSCIELELGSGFDKIFWSPNSFWTKCIENMFLQKMSF